MKRLILLLIVPTSAFAGSIDYAWTPGACSAAQNNCPTGFNIYLGTTNGGPYPTKIPFGNVTTGTVPNLTNGTTYYGVVKAFNSAGESPASNQAVATVPPLPVAVPDAATNLSGVGKQ